MPADTTTVPRRRSPFIRPADLPPFRLQWRDVVILRAVARFHQLDTEQIFRLVKLACAPSHEPVAAHLKPKDPSGHSIVHLRRRLRLLVLHGYLALPEAQRYLSAYSFKADGGSVPLVFALDAKGAKEVNRHEHYLDQRTAWTSRAKRTSPFTISHTLQVSEFMTRMMEDAAARGLTLRDHVDLIPDFPAAKSAHDATVFQLSVTLPDQCRALLDPKDTRLDPLTVHAKPDRLFSVFSADGASRYNFALEVDRQSETISPKFLSGQASIRRKMFAFWHAVRNGLHTTQWGFTSLRVLVQTHTQSHLDAMLAELEAAVPGGSGLFLFGIRDQVHAEGPLAPVWTQRARGETSRVSLIREHAGTEQ